MRQGFSRFVVVLALMLVAPYTWATGCDIGTQGCYVLGQMFRNGNFAFPTYGADPFTCGASTAGASYYSSASNVVKYCNGTSWQTVGTGGGISGLTTNQVPKASSATAIADSDFSNASSGVFQGPAGTAVEFKALLPTAAASTTAGVGAKLTASAATAGTTNAGAAAGGSVAITGGDAARNASGNADGGGLTVSPGNGIGTGIRGPLLQQGNPRDASYIFQIKENATTSASFELSTTPGAASASLILHAGNAAVTVGSGGALYFDTAKSVGDAGLARVAASVVKPIGASAAAGWLQQVAGRSRVNGDVTNATNTMANITGLSATLIAGRKYTGELILKCNNSTAAEGIAVDFDGGAATMTSFAAGAGVLTGGTTVAVTTVSSAIATDFDWSTITGETWITFKITMVVNAGGTFIPRFRESTAHTSGTATVSLGSYLWLEDTP